VTSTRHSRRRLGYGPFARLLRRSTIVLTDSGGVPEEAPSLEPGDEHHLRTA